MSIEFHRPEQRWLDHAVRLQALAQTGLAFSKDPFDLERYDEIRHIATEMLAAHCDADTATLNDLFCCEKGYQTPKIDSRGAVFDDQGRILLVQEKLDRQWAMPGGYVDIDQTMMGNTVKEVFEEAGYHVRPGRLILVQDHRFKDAPKALSISRFFFSCELIGGSFHPNSETLDSRFFDLNDLPPLCERKTTPQQISICAEARKHKIWQTVFI